MRFILFTTEIRDGENEYLREHVARITKEDSNEATIEKLLKEYLEAYFSEEGTFDKENKCVWEDGDIRCISIDCWRTISEEEYRVLSKYLPTFIW